MEKERYPKIAELDAQTLAREVVRDAMHRVTRTLLAVAPMGDYRLTGPDQQPLDTDNVTLSTGGEAIVRLVEYAQRGAPLDASVQEYAITLMDFAGDALDDATSPSPTTPLGAVLGAALGREDLESGRPISNTRLAILAGVSPQYIRKLVAAGELTSKDSEVKAKEAKRWLSARGIEVA